ncbi:MAG: FAD-binding monooxygenase [Roseiflexaceae bacterium]
MPTHAIIIGASMAGLLTARVLSRFVDQVTILERDPVQDTPEARRGQPQTRHTHALLAQGHQVIEQLFPGLTATAVAEGAISGDMAERSWWYTFGGYRRRFPSGYHGILSSRPFLEWQVRRRLLELPNITLRDQVVVDRLITNANNQRILGVAITQRGDTAIHEQLSADLVIDCTGRGSQSPKWLEAIGYGRPPEQIVKVDMGYATRVYRAIPGDQHEANSFLSFQTPPAKCAGFAFRIEGDRWIVTIGGHHGMHAPTDQAGFLEFARNLPTPEIYDLISRAEPLSEIMAYKIPSSLRRNYEQMRRFPEGYLVLGDAICSFNPIYGQGMTSAALQAQALDQLLSRRHGMLTGLAKPFFRQAAKVIDIPWQLAVGEDFRFPETSGPKAFGTDLINQYVAMIHRATHRDPVVYGAFLKVMNLIATPTSLFAPDILWRVIRAQ